jgi:hypothetical protein
MVRPSGSSRISIPDQHPPLDPVAALAAQLHQQEDAAVPAHLREAPLVLPPGVGHLELTDFSGA